MKRVLFMSLLMGICMFSGCSMEGLESSIMEATNIEMIKYVHREMQKGNIDVMDEVLAEDYIRHCQAMPPELQELRDKEVFKTFLKDFVEAAPGYTDSIWPIFADSNMVSYVSTMKGVQTGQMGGLPASGKEFTCVNLVMHRFENGKIAETWVSWDNVAMLTQLGYFPPPDMEKL